MLANYHTHTWRCQHANGEDREYVEAAIEGGLRVLGISDHCPWDFQDGHVSRIRMTMNQLDEYFSSFIRLREEYKKDITIYIGFESEYIGQLIDKQNEVFKQYPLDYMILGQHFNGPEKVNPYTGLETKDASFLESYVDLVIRAMDTGDYKYIAHPDLIHYTGDYHVYEYHMTRLCAYLKERKIPVEINMLGLMEGRHYPSERFFQIASKIGNCGIVGIDAHIPSSLNNVDGHTLALSYAKKHGIELIDYIPGLGPK